MDDERPPLDALRDDLEQVARNRWQNLRWWASKWLGAQLIKLLLGGAISVGLLWVAFPYAVAAAFAAAFVLLAAYTVYQRKQLVDERSQSRWAWVGSKRLRQDVLAHDLALDHATLILAGHPQDRQAQFKLRAPGRNDFLAALRYRDARARAAAAEQRPQPAKAARRGASSTPAQPDVAKVRRRRDVTQAELNMLEAEIQSLATPQAIDLARAAKNAGRSHRELRKAVHEADRTARDHHRAGRVPTTREPGISLDLAMHANGRRDVRRTASAPTPEQIAQGHLAAHDNVESE